MAVAFKDAVKKMEKDPGLKYFYFFCEKAADNKPVVLADTKKIDPKKDEEAKEIVAKAKAPNVSTGTMQVNEEKTLVLKPQGAGLSKGKLEMGVKIAAGNAKILNLIQGVSVGEPEGGGGDDEEAEKWKQQWKKVGDLLEKAVTAKVPALEVLQKMAGLAQQRAEKEEYEQALAVLEKLQPQIVSALETPSTPPVDMDKLKERVGTTTGTVAPEKKQKYQESVEALLGKSEVLSRHLDNILGKKGTKVVFVTDDPDMGSGGAYFDTKSNQIRINAATDPEKMADNLVFESCNAGNREIFQELDDKFRKGTAKLGDYGLAKAKTEFQTSVRYATLLKDLKDQGVSLGGPALKQLEEFDKKAPGYFDETDPEKRKEMLETLEKSFCESPHDVDETEGPNTLPSADMYMYEKIKGLSTTGALNFLFLEKHRKPIVNEREAAWKVFRAWVDGYPEDVKKKVWAFYQVAEAGKKYFHDLPIDHSQFKPTAKMLQVAKQQAGGWSLPACPERPS